MFNEHNINSTQIKKKERRHYTRFRIKKSEINIRKKILQWKYFHGVQS